jgi:hypothetical protein
MVICEVSFGCFATSVKNFTNAGALPRSSPLGPLWLSADFSGNSRASDLAVF